MSARKTQVNLRLMVPTMDLDEVLEIEHGSFDRPWDRKDFFNHLKQPNCGGTVAHFAERIVGFVIYYLEREAGDLFIANLAVAPDARRCSVGTRLIAGLLARANKCGLSGLTLMLDRRNVAAVNFYRFHQFKVTRLMPACLVERPYAFDAWEMKYSFNPMEIKK